MPGLGDILDLDALVAAGVADTRKFAAGEAIVEAGKEERAVYLIVGGTVRVTGRVELDDDRHIQPGLCDLGPGEVFGELSLFADAARSASVVAVDECDLLALDAAALEDYFDRHPEVGYAALKWLFSVINQRLRSADKRLEGVFAWGLRAHGIDRDL
jgi:CRP-like cAMP-binding protein